METKTKKLEPLMDVGEVAKAISDNLTKDIKENLKKELFHFTDGRGRIIEIQSVVFTAQELSNLAFNFLHHTENLNKNKFKPNYVG